MNTCSGLSVCCHLLPTLLFVSLRNSELRGWADRVAEMNLGCTAIQQSLQYVASNKDKSQFIFNFFYSFAIDDLLKRVGNFECSYCTNMSKFTLLSSVVQCLVVQYLTVYFCIFSEFSNKIHSNGV
jgi:hypothetical protein